MSTNLGRDVELGGGLKNHLHFGQPHTETGQP